jgi:hypothetical protein
MITYTYVICPRCLHRIKAHIESSFNVEQKHAAGLVEISYETHPCSSDTRPYTDREMQDLGKQAFHNVQGRHT